MMKLCKAISVLAPLLPSIAVAAADYPARVMIIVLLRYSINLRYSPGVEAIISAPAGTAVWRYFGQFHHGLMARREIRGRAEFV
jgi:hypothetical protein